MPWNTGRAGSAAGAAAMVLAWIACLSSTACTGDPSRQAGDPAAIGAEYHRLEQQALVEIRAWGASSEDLPDPRPTWAAKLSAFADAHPEAPEAVEALQGAMQILVAARDMPGFLKAYDALLRIAPDAPELPSVFEQIKTMRVIEAGGPTILSFPDDEARRRAYRRAAPLIAADIGRALAAAKTPAGQAAAHFAIGETWFLLDLDLGRALTHFKIVSERHADSPWAEEARHSALEIETLGPGRPAPDFTAVALDGKRIKLSDLRGSIVLIDFWATWCMPCLVELPHLRRTWERFHARGFTIVGVSIESDGEAVKRFASDQEMSWPVVVDGAEGNMATGPLAQAYSVESIPMSYLVDRDGTIRARRLLGEGVERAVEDLLGRRVASARPEGASR